LLLAGCAGPLYDAKTAPHFVEPPPSAGVTHASGTWTRGDMRFFEQSWRPAGEPKAVVVIMHGLKDHSSRYAELATTLVARGYAVHAFDLRGHGYSEGRRVYIDNFSEYVDDLDAFVARVRLPGKPLFVFGHSMGGAIVTTWLLDKKPDVRGIILSGAALRPTPDVTPFLIRATKSLGRQNPRLAVFGLPNKNFSRDPKVVDAIDKDPCVYQSKAPARTAAQLVMTLERNGDRMEAFAAPLLALHGGKDIITNPDGTRELVRRASSTDKTLKIYDGFFHDLLHEPDHGQVIIDIATWLDAHP
jgi:alpha-beta hydrolase superfamily lysophospholipase